LRSGAALHFRLRQPAASTLGADAPARRRSAGHGRARAALAATYEFDAIVARRWQQGRVLLAGDAAHQTPPFLGQGVCAGLRDIANLAWKLGHALRHPASAQALLATYGPERLPHAREFVALAVEVGRVIQVTDPVAAQQRDARLLAQGLSFAFPSPRLGPGVHRGESSAVGRIAPQFEGPQGTWSDDAAGPRWSVWLDAGLAASLPDSLHQRLATLGITLLADPGTKARDWLALQGAAAALLRPDRYVFDLCRDAHELGASLDVLAHWVA
jgi:3-(3-hydroxy-phenyl)propionate hydroxylase